METEVPEEITRKYPKNASLAFPKGDVETPRILKGVFVPDHNSEREYWKGFEIVEWNPGEKELRLCYWTRERGTKSWNWGQFTPIISLDKLKTLIEMAEKEVT